MWMSLNTPGQLSEAMDNEESPGRVEGDGGATEDGGGWVEDVQIFVICDQNGQRLRMSTWEGMTLIEQIEDKFKDEVDRFTRGM